MNTQRQKILIIDDDVRNIFALSATLRAKGYTCITASGAEEGMQLLEKHPDIGVVLLDMMMPDMDGYEAIPLIKKKFGNRPLPVIAVTAQAMSGDREKCLEAGADEYISKPVNVDYTLQILNKYINLQDHE